jgi:hypothetical protein
MVELVACPVEIAWKRVSASLPLTSPTIIKYGRCLSAALRRSYMETSPVASEAKLSRVISGNPVIVIE